MAYCKEHNQEYPAKEGCPRCWLAKKIKRWDAEENRKREIARAEAVQRHKKQPFKKLGDALEWIERRVEEL